MRLSYSLRKDEYVSALEAVVGSISATPTHAAWERSISRIGVAHYLLMGAVALAGAWTFPGARVEIVAVSCIFVFLHVAVAWAVSRVNSVGVGATFDPRRHTGVTATLEPGGVGYAGREYRQTWDWPLLLRLHDLPDVHVLEFVGFDMLVLPKRAFSSRAEERDWIAEIRRHLP